VRKRIAIVNTISKDTARHELERALANYAGPIKRCPPGGSSSKRRPPKPRTEKRWREA
jgi:hypothetical protein